MTRPDEDPGAATGGATATSGPTGEDRIAAATRRGRLVSEESPRSTPLWVCLSPAAIGLFVLVPARLFGGIDFGLFFGGVIAAIVVHRWVRWRRAVRRRRRTEELRRSGAPVWEGDWEGSRTVLCHRLLEVGVPPFLYPVVTVAVLGAVSWGSRSAAWETRVACALAPVVAIVGILAWVVARGRAQVRLEGFPVFVGSRATFWIATTPGSPRLTDAVVRLRCHSPVLDERGKALVTPQRQFWDEERGFPADGGPGPDEFVAATFDLPAAAPGTDGTSWPPVIWTLTVTGRSRWGPFEESFAVPVYAPPSRPGGAALTAPSAG